MSEKFSDTEFEMVQLRDALTEIAGSKSLTATPTQFYQHLQRLAGNALTAHAQRELTAMEPGSTHQDKSAIFKSLGLVPWDNKPPACTDTVWIEPGKIDIKKSKDQAPQCS